MQYKMNIHKNYITKGLPCKNLRIKGYLLKVTGINKKEKIEHFKKTQNIINVHCRIFYVVGFYSILFFYSY